MILTNGINLRVSPTGRLMGSGASTNLYWMFTNSEVGGYIDLAPIYPHQSLYQDVAGTTPVTAPGQTVALALMKGAREVEARRNLISPTEDIQQWGGATLGTPVANAITAPDGTLTADLIVEGTISQRHIRQKTVTFLPSRWYTFSVHAKAGTRGFAGVVIGKSGSPYNRVGVVVDLSDGSFTDYNVDVVPDVIRHPVENLPDGWKRIAVSVYTGAVMTDGYAEVFPSNGSSTYLGDGVSGVYLWGAQVELGAAPTAYQSVSLADGSWTPGQHFVQSSASLRPTYAVRPKGGRKNYVTWTEQFDNAAWVKSEVTVSANAVDAPAGTLTADKLIPSVVATADHALSQSVLVTTDQQHTVSLYAKAGGYNFVFIRGFGLGGAGGARFDVSTGVVSGVAGYTSATITSVGGGWYRCTATGIPANQSLFINVGSTSSLSSYSGDGVSGVYIWGAQVVAGALPLDYQRVTSMFDVYEAGKTHYGALWFDGVDDFMVSGTVTPGTDKVQVFAGVRKNSDAAVAILIESSVTSASNNGTFAVFAPNAAATNYLFMSKGTVASDAIALPHAAQTSQTLVGYGDIATDTSALRVNAVAAVTSATDQGTGNYLAYPIYLGRRGGTSLPFNGEIEALIGYRFGPNLSDTQLTQIATFINSRTGAYV